MQLHIAKVLSDLPHNQERLPATHIQVPRLALEVLNAQVMAAVCTLTLDQGAGPWKGRPQLVPELDQCLPAALGTALGAAVQLDLPT
jgi:hypothetical protein